MDWEARYAQVRRIHYVILVWWWGDLKEKVSQAASRLAERYTEERPPWGQLQWPVPKNSDISRLEPWANRLSKRYGLRSSWGPHFLLTNVRTAWAWHRDEHLQARHKGAKSFLELPQYAEIIAEVEKCTGSKPKAARRGELGWVLPGDYEVAPMRRWPSPARKKLGRNFEKRVREARGRPHPDREKHTWPKGASITDDELEALWLFWRVVERRVPKEIESLMSDLSKEWSEIPPSYTEDAIQHRLTVAAHEVGIVLPRGRPARTQSKV